MTITHRLKSLLIVLFCISFIGSTYAAPPPDNGGGNSGGNSGNGKGGGKTQTLSTVKSKDWDEFHVRRVLAAFAYGGLATEQQIETWGSMKPAQAVSEMLTFSTVNSKLSPPDLNDDTSIHCGSLAGLQAFWSGDDPRNMMKYADPISVCCTFYQRFSKYPGITAYLDQGDQRTRL